MERKERGRKKLTLQMEKREKREGERNSSWKWKDTKKSKKIERKKEEVKREGERNLP